VAAAAPALRGIVSFREALGAWVKIAVYSLGGPAGQIAVMHRILVEEKRWLSERRFLHALNYCMLLPGPEAQQLATYSGWLLHGWRGGLTAGLLFIMPGFVSILALSVLYVRFIDFALVAGLFYGLKPAVMAIVLGALTRIGQKALQGGTAVGLAGAAFVAIFFRSSSWWPRPSEYWPRAPG
jgi:chromate transporter